ncbi:MAG: phospho-sugar mutase [Planctomycetaceae bacterium]|nr:phospho-sugar mutase [Planctomycetaceae bacterium]
MATRSMDVPSALSQLDAAVAGKTLTPSAAANIRQWLTQPRYAEYAPQVAEHIAAGKWKELDDVFWTVIPFGTGGRRGRMYPIGCNAINDRTIGESAQGLAEYVKTEGARPHHSPLTTHHSLSCAIAYDTRHNSRRFAELCAEVMVANGFRVYFLGSYRSTPQLSFLVRHKGCACGIMVTASHNPPSDNAVKVYWSTGGQVVPPHDAGIVERVMQVHQIKRADFEEAVKAGQIELCHHEIDVDFGYKVIEQGFPGPRKLKIIYSPLHGVGEFAAVPALENDGFADIEIFAPHGVADGDFPNVPGHVANPENPAVFDAIIERAKEVQADLILATDPDCDRMGCAAPKTKNPAGDWGPFTGNQLSALLADFVCEQRKKTGRLTKESFLVTTLVTTPMIRRIGDSYGIRTLDQLHVGFKWIAQQVDVAGPENFVFGTEESHGFMIGQYVRDKDGAAACMLMAELAAAVKATGKTLFDRLESLYWQHGYHGERQVSIFMTGSAGMARMQSLMQKLRTSPPNSLGGIPVRQVRDYLSSTQWQVEGPPTVEPIGRLTPPARLNAPRGDMVILDLAEEGHYVAIRPSGTEPKVKFYLFTFVPAEQLHLLAAARQEMNGRLDAIEADLRKLAEAV